MQAEARAATPADLDALEHLYRGLESEMIGLKAVWAVTEALPESARESIAAAITDGDELALLGLADGHPAGFLIGRIEPLLPQAGAARHGVIRFVFTDPGFRELGVGEAMIELFLAWADDRGVSGFDAHVSPGHRLAKNFFEANGFKARHIVMHREA